jgi:DNA-directed RNA polymerase sigma subunit (sigma70/sigma32)
MMTHRSPGGPLFHPRTEAGSSERPHGRGGLRERVEGKLNALEREFFSLRFGLEGAGPLPLGEVARRLGLTGELVRRIEAHAVSKLRE